MKRIFLLLMMVFPVWVYAEDDLAGSADDAVLERFRGAWIVNYQTLARADYRFALGSLEQVNGVERPEREARLSGALTRISYQIPDGSNTRDVFNHFYEQLKARDAQVLYECRGRECGSSNHWANDIFRFSRLYGVDRTQYYTAASLPGVSVALYVVERGNRRIYAHIDVIETDPAARLISTLTDRGYATWVLDDQPLSKQRLAALAQALAPFPNKLAVTVHHQGDSFADALDKAQRVSDELTVELAELLGEVTVVPVGRWVPSVLKQHESVIVFVAGEAR